MNEINTVWTTAPRTTIPRDLVHHFTGKVTDPYFGAATTALVCNGSNPRCWTQHRDGQTHQTVAHEIGHLLNGIHVSPSTCNVNRTIMCQGEDKQMTFSAAQRTRINSYIDSKSCMDYNSANIIGTSPLCVNQNKTFTFAVPLNATSIAWSLSNTKATIQSGQGTGSVTVRGVSSGQVSLTVTVDYPGTICGQIVETKSLQIGPSLSMYWTPSGSSGDLNVTVYGGQPPWTFYKNGSLIHTAYLSSTTVPFGCSSGTLQVRSTTSCGTGTYTDSVSGNCFFMFYVHPNPTTAEINVSLLEEVAGEETIKMSEIKSNPEFENFVLTLLDFSGNPVREISVKGNAKNIQMEVSTLSRGIYFLKIVGRELDETHKVLIEVIIVFGLRIEGGTKNCPSSYYRPDISKRK